MIKVLRVYKKVCGMNESCLVLISIYQVENVPPGKYTQKLTISDIIQTTKSHGTATVNEDKLQTHISI